MKKITILVLTLLVSSSICFSSVPGQINFQGLLKDSAGKPVNNSAQTITFSIYAAPTGGVPVTALWYETKSVTVENGMYSTQLGDSNPLLSSVFDGSTRYLGIAVGTDPEMAPRLPLISVPYAFRAASAASVDSFSISDYSITTNKIANNAVTSAKLATGAVTRDAILSTNSPSTNQVLRWSGTDLQWATVSSGGSAQPDNITIDTDINGSFEVMNSGITAVQLANNAVTTNKILDGNVTTSKILDGNVTTSKILDGNITTSKIQNNAITSALMATAAVTKDAISTSNSASSNQYLQWNGSNLQWAASSGGNADTVNTLHASAGATANYLYPLDGNSRFNLSGNDASFIIRGANSNAADGAGVSGEAVGTNGRAVYGLATGSNGKGIYGINTNTGASAPPGNCGGYFESAGDNGGTGVYGYGSNSSTVANYGGYFRSDGANGYAVYGRQFGGGNNYGGFFQADGVTGKAVYGYATGNTGYAGYFYALNSAGYSGYFKGGKGVFLENSTLEATWLKGNGSQLTGVSASSGNADTVDTIHASTDAIAHYLYPLDGSAKVPLSVLYTGTGNGLDADTVDTIHASTTASANKLLALDGTIKFPNAVLHTGHNNGLDADMVDTIHASPDATANYLYPLDANKEFSLTNTVAGATAIKGISNNNGTGVYGKGVNYGVSAEATAGTGTGVYALASNAAGADYGVYGQSEGNAGTGVYGVANNAGGGGNSGVKGESKSGSGYGVYALNTVATGAASGAALYVSGRIAVPPGAAAGSVPGVPWGGAPGAFTTVVNNPLVTPVSLIFIFPDATLGPPPSGTIWWIVAKGVGTFTVMSNAGGAEIAGFSYLIIN